jgi:drug/metabolite transporter (DMT)-like permease
VGVLLGVASALVYGAADFLGGLASRRSSPYSVVVWSQFAGLIVLLAAVAILGDPVPSKVVLGWGVLGGIGGGGGVVLLYRGLSVGRMSVVAPTASVGGASLPVLVGIVLGERPSPLALLGVVVALAAIVLVSSSSVVSEEHRIHRVPPGLFPAIGAGVGFALFFVSLDNVPDTAGLWPLLAARVSIMVAAVAGVAMRTTLRPARADVGGIVACGIADMLANLLYLLASRRGLLSIVAVLVSLYPASTVLLARVVLHERLSGAQVVGLVAAAVGVGLIAGAA